MNMIRSAFLFTLATAFTLKVSGDPAPLIPFTLNALAFHVSRETGENATRGNCPTDPPNGIDAQLNTDPTCHASGGPCHVAFTSPGDYVAYNFMTSADDIVNLKDGGSEVFVDITLRIASNSPSKQVHLELYDDLGFDGDDQDWGEGGPWNDFDGPGQGYDVFRNVTWKMAALQAVPTHRLLVSFPDGNVNLCSITIVPSRETPSYPNHGITWSPLEYFEAQDTTEEHFGTCGDADDPVDAQPTTDVVCVGRDHSLCNVGFVEPGESLTYHFYVNDDDDYDLWVRVASGSDTVENPKVTLELNPIGVAPFSRTFDVRQNGWQVFSDVVWDLLYLEENEYFLTVHFDTGAINLCSVAVKPSTSRYDLYAPGNYTALMFYDHIEKTPEHFGNCPMQTAVDAQVTDDPVCLEARRETDVACHVGWTQAGEALFYTFVLDEGHPDLVNFSWRASSNDANRRIRVQANDFVDDFRTPGKGFDTFETETVHGLNVTDTDYLHVSLTFLQRNINLCSVGVDFE